MRLLPSLDALVLARRLTADGANEVRRGRRERGAACTEAGGTRAAGGGRDPGGRGGRAGGARPRWSLMRRRTGGDGTGFRRLKKEAAAGLGDEGVARKEEAGAGLVKG